MKIAAFRPMAGVLGRPAPSLAGPEPNYLLQVIVDDEAGEPVEGLKVEIFYADDTSEEKTTHSNGVALFDFELHRGPAQVKVGEEVREVDLTAGGILGPLQENFVFMPATETASGPGIAGYVAGTIAVIGLLAAGGVFK